MVNVGMSLELKLNPIIGNFASSGNEEFKEKKKIR